MEQFHLLRFPVLSCLVSIPDLQEVLLTDPELCDVDQNLLFASISAPPPFQPNTAYLEHEVWSFSGTRDNHPKLPIVELTCTLESVIYGLPPFFNKAFTVFTPSSASPSSLDNMR